MTNEHRDTWKRLREYLDKRLGEQIDNYSTTASSETREEKLAGVDPEDCGDIPLLQELIREIDGVLEGE